MQKPTLLTAFVVIGAIVLTTVLVAPVRQFAVNGVHWGARQIGVQFEVAPDSLFAPTTPTSRARFSEGGRTELRALKADEGAQFNRMKSFMPPKKKKHDGAD